MTGVHARRFGQRVQRLVDRVVERLRAAGGEVRPARSVVLDEERVAGEQRVVHAVRHAGRRMTRRRDALDAERSRGEDLAVFEEAIELAAVDRELGPIEDAAKGLLHRLHALADGDLRAEPLFEPLPGRQVIGVRVGLERVVHPQAFALDHGGDLLDRRGARLARPRLVVEHGVDHDRVAGGRIIDEVRQRPGRRIEELTNSGG